MSKLNVGDTIPHVDLHRLGASGLETHASKAYFAGRRIAVFSLPGAFTPTCSASHVPRYDELQPLLAARGIDEIICLSVNDAFVMRAWGIAEGADRITFLADGNGDFTRGMGQLVGKESLGFGERSWRYSMIVNDGTIEALFEEPHEPGDPYGVSDADTMLAHLDADAEVIDIAMITKPGCSHCARARQLLTDKGLEWTELPASPRVLRAVSETHTTPRIFVNGRLIGGADELEVFLD